MQTSPSIDKYSTLNNITSLFVLTMAVLFDKDSVYE